LFKIQRGDVSFAKRDRVLSRNEIRETAMDSDTDEDKYCAPQESEDEEEPRPLSRRSSISQPPSPDYSVSSSGVEDDVGNVAGQQPQPSQWTLHPKPQRR
jgi:hypothetical protein